MVNVAVIRVDGVEMRHVIEACGFDDVGSRKVMRLWMRDGVLVWGF